MQVYLVVLLPLIILVVWTLLGWAFVHGGTRDPTPKLSTTEPFRSSLTRSAECPHLQRQTMKALRCRDCNEVIVHE
jgi:zona occludens toxin (predicted ATPase)